MNLRFIQLHAIPVHIHHKSSTGNQSLHTSCGPGIRKSRKQMYSSVMALQQHFSHTGSVAKITVNLKRRMSIKQIRISPSLRISLFHFIPRQQLQHIINNPERMITVQQTGPQINFPANGPTGSFVATL